MTDKKYLCGVCGKVNDTNPKNSFCNCGADYWIELEDFGNPDLISYINTASKQLNLTPDEMIKKVR